MANTTVNLSEKEMRLLALAWQCFDNNPKIDNKKLAKISGYTEGSAQVTLGKIKRKLAAAAADVTAEADNADDATNSVGSPAAAATATATPVKTPRKRAAPKSGGKGKGAGAGGEEGEGETPKKKQRATPAKKKAVQAEVEAEVGEEEEEDELAGEVKGEMAEGGFLDGVEDAAGIKYEDQY
ncbi:hypothetical protein LTS18_013494 [Coniosporium uncinatum]|uniref:Uncharacterized protein n=1 Tax=Coniosporium uncinatum TaxID=93489 RepID=A0ACC3DHX6_9PEZI|nr:hypothetical protein LTS18_013494 [Coniosporium uncinatum]